VDLQSYSSSSDPATATPTAVPSFWEQDLRYDSVTQSGGGIRLSWDNPTTAKKGIVNTGVATISGPGGPWVLPFVKAQVVQHINGTYLQNQLNLSPPLTSGGRYSATIELNYTTILHPIVSSNSANFAYHLDTSGNGLTNNEQEAGWNVTLQPCFAVSGLGKACGILKRAYPGAYATNGLASDFLEKELDLNPNTLDSATSHMLDLWNLTFSLLSNGVQQSVPKGIRVWWENSSLNPFGGKDYPNGPNLSGVPKASNVTNLSCSKSSCVADTPWSAEVLWSYSALMALTKRGGFTNATNASDWFRGVVGTWRGIPTITLWGKLSWGANPLAMSTIGTNLPDGARVNPMRAEDLEVNFSLAQVCVGSTQPNAFNWAVGFYVNNSSTSGAPELHNYSYEIQASGAVGCSNFHFSAAIPVNDSYQAQSVTFSFVRNWTNRLSVIPTSGGCRTFNATYDMLLGGRRSLDSTLGCTGSGRALWSHLVVNLSAVSVGQKDPTYLMVPTGNGTVRNLPGGALQYIGEQSFDAVIVNVTSPTPVRSDNIPVPWTGSAYSITLAPGPNTILVPRSLFLNSTFGYSLLRDMMTPQLNKSLWSPAPLMGTIQDEAMQGLLGSIGNTTLGILSCYWQDRALPTIASPPLSGALCRYPWESGVSLNSPNLVNVFADGGVAQSVNGGGLPSNPTLENASNAGPALQDVITLNLTNSTTGNGYNLGPTPSLDLVLAGLLDNFTGGVNGTIVNVTSSLGVLGLDSAVLAAIPNSSVVSSGLYGPPIAVSQGSGDGKGCSWLGCLWTTVTGVWNWLVNGVEEFANFGWLGAIESFFENLPTIAKLLLLTFIDPALAAYYVLTTLTNVGAEILNAIVSTLNWLGTQIIDRLLNPVVNWLTGGVKAYFLALNASFGAAYADTAAGRPVSSTHANGVWGSLAGSVFQGATLLSGLIEIAIVLVASLSLGGGFLVTIVIQLLASALAAGGGSTSGVPTLSSWGGPGVSAAWAFANVSLPSQKINQILLTTWIQVAADAAAFSLAYKVLVFTLAGGGQGILGSLVTLVTAIISLTADVAAKLLHSAWIAWIGLLSGVIGTGLGIYYTWKQANPYIRLVTGVGAGLSGFGALVGAALVESD